LSLINNQTNVFVPIVDKFSHSAIDYDARDSTIYYSDSTHFRILKKGLNKANSEVFLDKGVSHSEGIAIDWAGRNLYWTDENLNVIYVANLEHPEYKKLLVSTNLTHVKSIVVHPGYGYGANYCNTVMLRC